MSLDINHLFKTYKKYSKNKLNAINDVCFVVQNGQILALVGQNGAGKTTTIKCLLGLMKADSGTVSFDRMAINSFMAKVKVGFMPEILHLTDLISARSYLMDLAYLRRVEMQCADAIERLGDLLSLGREILARPLANLSNGMKKKVNYIQSVMHQPELLILDEPTDGLDPVSRRIILGQIRSMADNGCTVLITSHILADLERIADTAAIMHEGRVLQSIVLADYFKSTQSCNIRLKGSIDIFFG